MTSISPVSEGYPSDLRALTSLRAFLALGVVLFHYQLQWDPALGFSPIIERSRLAVDAFFFLSGFILAHVYGPSFAAGTFSYRRFIVARLARLYPLHLAVLGGATIMVLGAMVAGVRFDSATYTLEGFFKTLFLIQAWFPSETGYNWSGPSWSLSAEWFAYLLFPAYALLAVRMRRRPWLLLGLGMVAYVVIDGAYGAIFGKVLPRAEDDMGILRIAPAFLIGTALYGLGRGTLWRPGVAIAACVVSTGLLLAGMQLSLDDRIIVALTAPVVFSWSMLAKTQSEGLLASPPLVFAGEVSFALYLAHMPILVAYKGLAAEMRGIDSGFVMTPLELAGLFIVTAAASVALHLLVEKPGRSWIRQAFERRVTKSVVTAE
ncbi:MAG: acyltransferase [Caulobacteraceae bacterium]|uniref:Acyltransferase family protein n=1 Tax=Brevundimonas staleyi TaxID=74326 RepID=A0ABW0FPP9_9CAUL|nr:acyltransferase [Brevundimonas diminuta]MBX9706585.1 acyltransferase [Caulobacteraceae bacterium]MDM8353509.1 acyltransferase [Brevundimonas diminuta]